MWQAEGWLLGRRTLSGGPVDAASLAQLVRSLGPAPAKASRRPPLLLRCRDDRLELAPRHDDEGFESDDDSRSLASDDTSTSSCCFVDDHVYRRAAVPRPVLPSQPAQPLVSTSSTTSDSANSSGASDTDEADHSVAALVQSLSLYQRVSKEAPHREPESVSVADVAFCHTDPALPKVAVWVVRKRRQGTWTAEENGNNTISSSGLEAIVFEASNERALRKLCSHFQEVSRRLKLDQYRHPHRRRENATVATLSRPSGTTSSSSPSSLSSSSSSSPAPLTRQHQQVTVPDNKLSRVEPAKPQQSQQPRRPEPPPATARFNLVQRTDGDGVTHIEVARDVVQELPVSSQRSLSGPSSIISLSTPEAPASTELDSKQQQQQQRPILVLGPRSDQLEAGELRKVWSPQQQQQQQAPGSPPQRPERRRFVRRNKQPAPQPPSTAQQQQQQQQTQQRPQQQQQKQQSVATKGDRTKVVRAGGQYVGVSQPSPWSSQYSNRRMAVSSGGSWAQRSRSKSPPRARRPMAYRYVDYSAATSLPARLLGGLSQRLRDAVSGGGGSAAQQVYGTASRRRSTPDVFRSAESLLAGAAGTHHLKSVIKKGTRRTTGQHAEPKKVTFSAYATVQVVD